MKEGERERKGEPLGREGRGRKTIKDEKRRTKADVCKYRRRMEGWKEGGRQIGQQS